MKELICMKYLKIIPNAPDEECLLDLCFSHNIWRFLCFVFGGI